jgi:hypothetical protein
MLTLGPFIDVIKLTIYAQSCQNLEPSKMKSLRLRDIDSKGLPEACAAVVEAGSRFY